MKKTCVYCLVVFLCVPYSLAFSKTLKEDQVEASWLKKAGSFLIGASVVALAMHKYMPKKISQVDLRIAEDPFVREDDLNDGNDLNIFIPSIVVKTDLEDVKLFYTALSQVLNMSTDAKWSPDKLEEKIQVIENQHINPFEQAREFRVDITEENAFSGTWLSEELKDAILKAFLKLEE